MPRGKLRHTRLSQEPGLPLERPLGILAHYLIGLTLTAGYLALLRARKAEPSLPTALPMGRQPRSCRG